LNIYTDKSFLHQTFCWSRDESWNKRFDSRNIE